MSRCGERQAAELAERLRHARQVALQHDDVAGLELDRAQAVRQPLAAAADREQPDLIALGEAAPARRSGRRAASRTVTTASITPKFSASTTRPARRLPPRRRELEPAQRNHAFERRRLAFEKQHVAGHRAPSSATACSGESARG